MTLIQIFSSIDYDNSTCIDFLEFKKFFEVNRSLQRLWTRFEAKSTVKQEYETLLPFKSLNKAKMKRIVEDCIRESYEIEKEKIKKMIQENESSLLNNNHKNSSVLTEESSKVKKEFSKSVFQNRIARIIDNKNKLYSTVFSKSLEY